MADLINNPPHYTDHWWFKDTECLDMIRGWEFRRGNAFKYVFRMWSKGDPDSDLDKAIFYLEDILIYDYHYSNRLGWWFKKFTITDKRFAKKFSEGLELDELQSIELKAMLRLYWGDIPGAHQGLVDLREALTGSGNGEA